MIELLAITDDVAPAAPPLRIVPAGGLGAVVGPAPDPEPDADALWQRESLLEALMEERALLPVRYGTVLADDAAAAEAVAERREALARTLERVRGAVELSVRAVGEPEHQPVAERIRAELSAGAREHVRQDGAELLRAAYLVDRGGVDAFVAAVRRLQHEHRELSILCTGPWPPYSFAEGDSP